MDRNDQYSQFKQLFLEYYNPLCNYVYSLISEKDSSEDIVQDLFTRIWEKHREVIQSDTIRAYLFKAARNSAFTFIGKRANLQVQPLPADDEFTTWDITDEPAHDNIHQYRELLQKGIAALPPKCREVFLLSRSGHLSNQEIADNLGISVNTVNNQTWKAMKLLKTFVKKTSTWLPPVLYYFFNRP